MEKRTYSSFFILFNEIIDFQVSSCDIKFSMITFVYGILNIVDYEEMINH